MNTVNEYNLPTDRMTQQMMIKKIAEEINPNFMVLFHQKGINVTIKNKANQSGKFDNHLDIHKVHDCLGDFIRLEKELFKSGIITEQLPEFILDYTRTTVQFSV